VTAFQLQTFIPQDGQLSITLPVHLRETDVELSIAKREIPSRLSKEEKEKYVAHINSFRGTLHDIDYSDLREKTDREL